MRSWCAFERRRATRCGARRRALRRRLNALSDRHGGARAITQSTREIPQAYRRLASYGESTAQPGRGADDQAADPRPVPLARRPARRAADRDGRHRGRRLGARRGSPRRRRRASSTAPSPTTPARSPRCSPTPKTVTRATRRLTLYALTAPGIPDLAVEEALYTAWDVMRFRIACRATRVRVPQAGPHQRWSRRLRMKNWPQLGASQYASAGEASSSTRGRRRCGRAARRAGPRRPGRRARPCRRAAAGRAAPRPARRSPASRCPAAHGSRRAAASSSAKIASRSSRTSSRRVSAVYSERVGHAARLVRRPRAQVGAAGEQLGVVARRAGGRCSRSRPRAARRARTSVQGARAT